MAWFDIAAGLAQGAQQGIDRVQADQVRRKADAFKDAQEKRALAAEARVASEDRRRQLGEELARQDPSNIDPAFVSQMTSEEKRSLLRPIKGPDGGALYQLRESPGATLERENKALAAGDFKPALAEAQAQRVYGAEKRDATKGAEKNLSDPNWLASASDNNIRAAWRQAGYTDDVSQYLSRAGRQKLIEMMPAYISGNLQLQGQKFSAEESYNRAVAGYQNAAALAAGRDTASQQRAAQSAIMTQANKLVEGGMPINEAVQQATAQYQAIQQQMGTGTGGGSAAASGLTWDTATNAWK